MLVIDNEDMVTGHEVIITTPEPRKTNRFAKSPDSTLQDVCRAEEIAFRVGNPKLYNKKRRVPGLFVRAVDVDGRDRNYLPVDSARRSGSDRVDPPAC